MTARPALYVASTTHRLGQEEVDPPTTHHLMIKYPSMERANHIVGRNRKNLERKAVLMIGFAAAHALYEWIVFFFPLSAE